MLDVCAVLTCTNVSCDVNLGSLAEPRLVWPFAGGQPYSGLMPEDVVIGTTADNQSNGSQKPPLMVMARFATLLLEPNQSHIVSFSSYVLVHCTGYDIGKYTRNIRVKGCHIFDYIYKLPWFRLL